MVRYAVCDVKPGFTYRIEDVEIGGEWQSVSAVPWKAGDRTFGVNGTGADFGDKYRFYSPHDASSFKGHVEIVSGFGPATDAMVVSAMHCDAEECDKWQGNGLLWAVVGFTTSDAAKTAFRENRVGLQNVRFRVKAMPTGKSVANPADVLRLHLKNEMGIADSRIDLPSFTATATLCTQRGYQCNGVMRSGQEYQAIQWILQTMQGALVQDSGKFYLKGLGNPAPVKTITESMLVEDPEIEHSIAWRERYNHARAEIIDKDEGWTKQSTQEIVDAGAFAEDGVKFLLDLGGLNFVNSQRQAYRLVLEELERRRHGRSIILAVHHTDAEGIDAYDNVTLNLEKNGVTGVWRVVNVLHTIDGLTELTLTSEEGVAAVDTTIGTPPAGSEFTLTATALSATTIVLAWTRNTDVTVTGWEYRRKQGSGAYGAWADIPAIRPGAGGAWNTTAVSITDLTAGTAYTFQVRAKKGSAVGSASNEATATTDALAVYSGTPVLTARENTDGRSVVLRMTLPVSFHQCRFRYRVSGSSSWNAWTASQHYYEGRYSYYSLTAGTTYEFQCQVVNSDGTMSPVSNTASLTFTGPTPDPEPPAGARTPNAPTNVRVTTTLNALGLPVSRVFWNPPSSGPAPTGYDVAFTYNTLPPSSTSSNQYGRWLTATGGASARSATEPLLGGVYFWVRARNAAGHGPTVRVRRA